MPTSDEYGDRRRRRGERHGGKRKQSAKARRASLRNLAKARRARGHGNWGPKSAKRGRRIANVKPVMRVPGYRGSRMYFVRKGMLMQGQSVSLRGGGRRKAKKKK
jgi:hypothetical protein